MKYGKKQAFSLAELIVIMSVILIISVIGIISIFNYTANTRDSVRSLDAINITKALQLNKVQGKATPIPDDFIEIAYSGSVVWYQGAFGEGVKDKISGMNGGFQDPKYNIDYTYSVSNDRKHFQIGSILEGETQLDTNGNEDIPYEGSGLRAYVSGNFGCGQIIKSDTHFISVPSIMSASPSETDYFEILKSKNLVTNLGYALPNTYFDKIENNALGFGGDNINPLIFTGAVSLLQNPGGLDTFAYNIGRSLSGTFLESVECYSKPSMVIKENYGLDVIFASVPDPSVTTTPTSATFDWVYSLPDGKLKCKSETLTSFQCEFPTISLTEGLGWGTDNTYQYFVNNQECGPMRDALTYTGGLSVEQCPWNFKPVGVDNKIQIYIPSGWWYSLSPEIVSMPLPPFNMASLVLTPNGLGFDFVVNSTNLTTDFRFYVNGHWCDQSFSPGSVIEGRIDELTNPSCGHLLNSPGDKSVMIRYNADTGVFWSDEVIIHIGQ